MYMMTITLTIISSLLFFYSTNPFSLGLILILQTISLSLVLGNMIKSFWFLYLLMLIFIGGMLVLFIYVTTIFPNEKFYFNQHTLMYMTSIMVTFTIFIFLINYFFNFNLEYSSLMLNFNQPGELTQMKSSMKMFISHSNMLIVLMVNYLFYCMIVVIKIVNFFKGPLRMMN